MKKGQIEMIGLVVIVVLVTIAIFYSATLKQPDTSKKTADTYTDEQLAGNYLIVLLESKPDPATCNAPTIKELAVDCIREQEGYTPIYDCGAPDIPDNCAYLNATIQDVIAHTIEPWGYNYDLTFTYTKDDTSGPLLSSTPDCSNAKEHGAPGIQFISLYPYNIRNQNPDDDHLLGSALFELQLC